ncbi:hypothetical protein BHE74_00006957 [Ensete ventricosum]|nr:hypothetical protein BHE74_00006957 [Ensete ventricosum]
MAEEEEGSSNVGCGCGVTSWLQVALVASRVRLQYEEDEAAMYTAVAEEGSSGMERETTVVVFNLLLSVIKIVGSERLLRAAM